MPKYTYQWTIEIEAKNGTEAENRLWDDHICTLHINNEAAQNILECFSLSQPKQKRRRCIYSGDGHNCHQELGHPKDGSDCTFV